ncbi:MAG: hypothetical protein R2825_02830 [Saprospiraceae bacterium]
MLFLSFGIICFALAASGKMPELAGALLDSEGNIINANAQRVFPLLVAKVLPA